MSHEAQSALTLAAAELVAVAGFRPVLDCCHRDERLDGEDRRTMTVGLPKVGPCVPSMHRHERLTFIVPFAIAAVGLALMVVGPEGALPEWMGGARWGGPVLAAMGVVGWLAGLDRRRQRILRERAAASSRDDGEDASRSV